MKEKRANNKINDKENILDAEDIIPESNNPPRKLSTLFAFAQIAALAGTTVDFLFYIFFTEIVGLWYVVSNIIGATMGAITNFLMGRYWVFTSTEQKIEKQAGKYILVSLGSLILNTIGVYLFTDFFGVYYVWSKVIVSVFIGVTYNFFLQKNFVYK